MSQKYWYWHRVLSHDESEWGSKFITGQLVGFGHITEELQSLRTNPKEKSFSCETYATFQYLGRLPKDATYEEVDKKFGCVGRVS